MVGGRTLHDEDPKLTVKADAVRAARVDSWGSPTPSAKVAIASRLDLRPDCKFLSAGPARILLFTTQQTALTQLKMLRSSGALVHVTDGERVDLEACPPHPEGDRHPTADGRRRRDAQLRAVEPGPGGRADGLRGTDDLRR